MNQQELEHKFRAYEQQIMQVQQQLQAIEKAILDITSISTGLGEFKGQKDLEIMTPVGRGIYAKTKLISEELLVDVGEGNFVSKSIDETKEIIAKQSEKLKEMQITLEGELERINNELTATMRDFQNANPQGAQENSHSHEHSKKDHECGCTKDEGCKGECSKEEGCGC